MGSLGIHEVNSRILGCHDTPKSGAFHTLQCILRGAVNPNEPKNDKTIKSLWVIRVVILPSKETGQFYIQQVELAIYLIKYNLPGKL